MCINNPIVASNQILRNALQKTLMQDKPLTTGNNRSEGSNQVSRQPPPPPPNQMQSVIRSPIRVPIQNTTNPISTNGQTQKSSSKTEVLSRLGRRVDRQQHPYHQPTENLSIKGSYNKQDTQDIQSSVTPRAIVPKVQSTVYKCKFGLYCTKPECTFSHPSPATQTSSFHHSKHNETKVVCKFFPRCMNEQCTFNHPKKFQNKTLQCNSLQSVMCKFEPFCKKVGCLFMHQSSVKSRSTRVFALDIDDRMEVDVDEEADKVRVP